MFIAIHTVGEPTSGFVLSVGLWFIKVTAFKDQMYQLNKPSIETQATGEGRFIIG